MWEQQAAEMCFLRALCCSPAVLLLPAPVLLLGAEGHQEQQPVVVSCLWQLAVPCEGGERPHPAAEGASPAMDWGCRWDLGGHSYILGACAGARKCFCVLYTCPSGCLLCPGHGTLLVPQILKSSSCVLFCLLHKHGQCDRRVCRSGVRSAPAILGPSVGWSESSPGNVGRGKQRWTHWHFVNGREC